MRSPCYFPECIKHPTIATVQVYVCDAAKFLRKDFIGVYFVPVS